MIRASLLLASVFLFSSSFIFATEHKPNTANPTDAPPVAQQASPAVPNDADVDAMRADLAHMRTLVGQMQRNLGFVDSGLTPLKHQFELEIEMWNVLISDMQRRLNARAAPQASPPSPPPQ